METSFRGGPQLSWYLFMITDPYHKRGGWKMMSIITKSIFLETVVREGGGQRVMRNYHRCK